MEAREQRAGQAWKHWDGLQRPGYPPNAAATYGRTPTPMANPDTNARAGSLRRPWFCGGHLLPRVRNGNGRRNVMPSVFPGRKLGSGPFPWFKVGS
jgi:hypothetical protein